MTVVYKSVGRVVQLSTWAGVCCKGFFNEGLFQRTDSLSGVVCVIALLLGLISKMSKNGCNFCEEMHHACLRCHSLIRAVRAATMCCDM